MEGPVFESRQRKRFFSSPYVQTDSEYQLASYSMGKFFPRDKRPGRNFDHSSVLSADIKNEWIYTSIALYDCKACVRFYAP